jgi:signal transduction histidine kinase
MDAESTRLFLQPLLHDCLQHCPKGDCSKGTRQGATAPYYANANAAPATPMVNFVNSRLSGTVEPVLIQEYKASLMQYPAESVQIGQQITQIILTSPEPQTLLARIAQALGEVFQVDTCLIVAGVKPVATTQIGLWCADDYPALPSGYQTQRLVQQALTDDWTGTEPLAIDDLNVADTASCLGWCSEMLPARAVLRSYTRFQSSVNGMIVLGRSQPHEWTLAEKELLIFVSESVAIAISQVQLTLQVQAATRHQTLLNQLSLAMRSTLDLDHNLQMAIASTAQTLQVNRGLLLLLKSIDSRLKDQPSKHLPKTKVTVAYEWLEETADQSAQAKGRIRRLLNQSFWLSESSLCQQAFRDAPELRVIGGERDAPTVDVPRKNLSIFDREMIPSGVIIPLVGTPNNGSQATSVLGFIVLQHNQFRLWPPEELELLKWVSTQVSATLMQNLTLRQVQSLAEERTAQLQQSLEVQAKLYEKTRQQMNQLQQLNHLKEEFMSAMSHELRTPLTKMTMAIRMLRQAKLPSEKRDKYLEILEEECNRESELIKDLLDLQRLEADQSQLQLEKIDLIVLIEKLAQSFKETWADKRLSLRVDCPAQSLMLNTDYDSLERILRELLTNAGKYSDPDTTVCLQVTHRVQSSVNPIVLTLTNSGQGISATDLPHIFERFHRGQGVTQKAVQGTGLGLALVKRLVQHLNGLIEVTSCPSENSQTFLTSFTLTLPQLQQQYQSLDQ